MALLAEPWASLASESADAAATDEEMMNGETSHMGGGEKGQMMKVKAHNRAEKMEEDVDMEEGEEEDEA